MGGLGERMRRWIQRDNDGFREASQEAGWGAWLFALGVLWVVGLALLAGLAALGRPMWGTTSVLVGVTGGLTLVRAYYRRWGDRTERPQKP